MKIELPPKMDLEENLAVTVGTMDQVRQTVRQHLRLRSLNFNKLRFISPAAALLLASEVDQWNRARKGRLRTSDRSWDPNVKQLLCEMGFFELLRIRRPAGLETTIGTVFLPFIRGEVDHDRETAGKQAQSLRIQIEETAGIEIRKRLLFKGLSEAITNVSQHAYPLDAPEGERPWWLFAAYERHSGLVTVAFYDHGLTIPGTLPAWNLFEQIQERFHLLNDGEKMHEAIKVGRSSTRKPGRGRGLGDLLDIVKGHPQSQLRIFSRRGLLTASNSNGNEPLFVATPLERNLKGTLIEWQFVPKDQKNESNLNS